MNYVRELTQADYALLASGRGTSEPQRVVVIRDRHHALARCLAQGMTNYEASAITGFDPAYISVLKGDPSVRDLIEHYKRKEDSALADYMDRATTLAYSTMNKLQEKVETDEVPTGMLLEIAKFASDRTGHAPVQKSVHLNASVDLGTRLKLGRERANQALLETVRVVEDGGSGSDT